MHLHEAHKMVGEDVIAFGAFELNRTRRILSKEGVPIAVRSRAMGILLALTETAGSVVSNRELLRRVWPNMVVENGTVRVHVSQLRSVLRKADPGNEYLHNVTGHGYRFAAPVIRPRRPPDAAVIHLFGPRKPSLRQPVRKNNVPMLMTSFVGGERAIGSLVRRMASKRFVTVTGPGGIGKTTAAIRAAGALAAAHADGVCFLDLAAIERPEEIWRLFAETAGISTTAPDPKPEILRCLSGQSLLLVLDNCEHVIESATRLAESVLRMCAQVKILATSREALRASGEAIHEVAPLELPPALDRTSCETLSSYPAIQLFVERAGADFDEQELSLIAQTCRRLAGNPLAIEIAAAQCRWLGLKALAVGLDDQMYLSLEGRRTAQLRHRTLRASFDWSYDLLSAQEQAVFRRVSVLETCFSADHAAAVIADERLPRWLVLKCLVNLARKSLLVSDTSRQDVVYGMHELVRAHARAKLHECQDVSFIDPRPSNMRSELKADRAHAHARLSLSASAGAGRLCGS
ncbi:winged helix-turn-helix domain-containing protein [Steroidobacter sp. S1-65]|uniref:Winged helix-turn-helix domain-containing protein n=1 Tax=Steroidobacter gossypii TaxID=2805490 RepID=A0ABS1X5Q3_9GAMM|nr:winged helix-turn-helix domain-containing protein [Steroidobacter gossypii]MBM0108553.1 winged helix-turn-helix domain-containing protein [Steroidobacter gossypii]